MAHLLISHKTVTWNYGSQLNDLLRHLNMLALPLVWIFARLKFQI
jgi:hypothetical protein